MTRARGGVASGLAVAALLLLAVPAHAHDSLLAVTPADGSTVDESPAAVVLEFSGSVQPLGTAVIVRGADGRVVSEGPTEVDGSSVSQRLVPLTADGRYEVSYRAVSADGHPVSGTTTFVARGLGPTMTEVAGAPVGARSDSGAADSRILVAVALVAIALLATAALVRARRRVRV